LERKEYELKKREDLMKRETKVERGPQKREEQPAQEENLFDLLVKSIKEEEIFTKKVDEIFTNRYYDDGVYTDGNGGIITKKSRPDGTIHVTGIDKNGQTKERIRDRYGFIRSS